VIHGAGPSVRELETRSSCLSQRGSPIASRVVEVVVPRWVDMGEPSAHDSWMRRLCMPKPRPPYPEEVYCMLSELAVLGPSAWDLTRECEPLPRIIHCWVIPGRH
jgi:hypothetical protein